MVGYVQNLQLKHVIHVFQEMLYVGSYPSNYTLATSLVKMLAHPCNL